VILVIAAFAFSLIIGPLISYFTAAATGTFLAGMMEAHPENRYVWPTLVGIAVALAVRKNSLLGRISFPPHLICFLACLVFAGASVLWAFNPDVSLTKFVAQMMIMISIVLPTMLAGRTTNILHGLFLCFAIASILNICVVLGGPPRHDLNNLIYYTGYMTDKNTLGQVEAIALLLALQEALCPGLRRVSGIVVGAISVMLLVISESKTSLALAILVPIVAKLMLIIRGKTHASLAIVVMSIAFGYLILSGVTGINVNKLSWYIYHNYTLSARTEIWDFVNSEIARRPLLGWGYQSFWLAGPNGPSVVDAWGWIRFMPHAHNGYLDAKLDGGIVGLAFLLMFIFATIHAIGRVADRDGIRAWLVLCLALFAMADNFLESSWMRANVVWMVFVIIAIEIGRYWQPLHPGGAVSGTRAPRPPGPSLDSRLAFGTAPWSKARLQPRAVLEGQG
jgi:O-antigen ligase